MVDEHYEKKFHLLLTHLFLSGMGACLVLIKLLQSFFNPSRANLCFCFGAFGLTTSIILVSGFWRYALPLNSVSLNVVMTLLAACIALTNISYMEFMLVFFNFEESNPRIHKGMRVYAVNAALLVFALMFVWRDLGLKMGGLITIILALLLLIASPWKYRSQKHAIYLVAG